MQLEIKNISRDFSDSEDICRGDYYSDEDWNRFLEFSKPLSTPFIVINLDQVRNKFNELKSFFPQSKIHYSIKANPALEIINLLNKMGSHFDIASVYEMEKAFSVGVSANKMIFGNTIKKSCDIEMAYQKGIRTFTTHCVSDIENIAMFAPGSNVFVRILVSGGDTADWPLSRKFGCHHREAIDLIQIAIQHGLNPYGLSFHVGSQQRAIYQWNEALAVVSDIYAQARKLGIHLTKINMGGGLPARYVNQTSSIQQYAQKIHTYLQEQFEGEIPEVILEPGRSMVGNSGIMATEIITISKKAALDNHRWVYIDAGKFNGLIETMDEGTKYPLVLEEDHISKTVGDVILAGPTCDSADILYEKVKYKLPLDAASGQRLYWLSTGAYTSSYASVEFNGFPPIKTYFMGS